jgi:hypothetical protein
MQTPSSSSLIRIILVHGTWGRGVLAKRLDQPKLAPLEAGRPMSETNKHGAFKQALRLRWFEAGSAFHVNLSRAMEAAKLEFIVSRFLWNSNNSIVDRNDAAIWLARHIRNLQANSPNDIILIIAHSHGGNVALRAIHIAGAAHTENVKLVTLATPFLKITTHTVFDPCEAGEGSLPSIPSANQPAGQPLRWCPPGRGKRFPMQALRLRLKLCTLPLLLCCT